MNYDLELCITDLRGEQVKATAPIPPNATAEYWSSMAITGQSFGSSDHTAFANAVIFCRTSLPVFLTFEWPCGTPEVSIRSWYFLRVKRIQSITSSSSKYSFRKHVLTNCNCVCLENSWSHLTVVCRLFGTEIKFHLVTWGGKFSRTISAIFFHQIFRFLKSSLNISIFNLFLVALGLRGCYTYWHSYGEIRTHATLKATQAQGHKKEVEEKILTAFWTNWESAWVVQISCTFCKACKLVLEITLNLR
jgi:hypothetical protein